MRTLIAWKATAIGLAILLGGSSASRPSLTISKSNSGSMSLSRSLSYSRSSSSLPSGSNVQSPTSSTSTTLSQSGWTTPVVRISTGSSSNTFLSTSSSVSTTEVAVQNPSSSIPGFGSQSTQPSTAFISGSTSPIGPSCSTSSGAQKAASTTTSAQNTPSTGPVCPDHDLQDFTDPSDGTYSVHCNTTFLGTALSSSNSTASMNYKQQAMTAKSCMDACDQVDACVAINFLCTGQCVLLGSMKGMSTGQCGVSAKRVSGPNNTRTFTTGSVITISVCQPKTRTTTVTTPTATVTTYSSTVHIPPQEEQR